MAVSGVATPVVAMVKRSGAPLRCETRSLLIVVAYARVTALRVRFGLVWWLCACVRAQPTWLTKPLTRGFL